MKLTAVSLSVRGRYYRGFFMLPINGDGGVTIDENAIFDAFGLNIQRGETFALA
jgi:hypothetical protein